MSDLFGNHIVGFPTRRLKYEPHVIHHVKKSILMAVFMQFLCNNLYFYTQMFILQKLFFFIKHVICHSNLSLGQKKLSLFEPPIKGMHVLLKDESCLKFMFYTVRNVV